MKVAIGILIFLLWATVLYCNTLGDHAKCWHHEWTQAECDAMGYE